ncbi:MAG: GNAT family N-acetyltransferase [bacterium]|nr:GNAT family N-acetyltransferase [bacterium]
MTDKKANLKLVDSRPETEQDQEFLYRLYASTRAGEMALTGWNDQQKEDFLRMQFGLQHKQYLENYKKASFDIILFNKAPAGRLYVDRRKKEIRIIDIALLPEFQRQGIGSMLMNRLIDEADKKEHPLSLHVEQDNPAMGLYEHLGFEKGKLVGVYYFMERKPRKPTPPPKPRKGKKKVSKKKASKKKAKDD